MIVMMKPALIIIEDEPKTQTQTNKWARGIVPNAFTVCVCMCLC